MKRYVQEKTEEVNGERLQVVKVFEEKQKPKHFSYILFERK